MKPQGLWPMLTVAAMLIATPVHGQETSPKPAPATRSDATELSLPVSLDRIREELVRERRLNFASARRPDFRIRVNQAAPFTVITPARAEVVPSVPGGIYAYEQARISSPVGATPVVGGFDVLSLVGSMVSNARRAHAERAARETVRRAMQEYCAAQPDHGAGIPSCAAVR